MSERNTRLDAIYAEAAPEIAEFWNDCREAGLEAHTEEATGAVDAEIRGFFERLKALPDPSTDEQVLAEMKQLYEALDRINADLEHGLLETDERELLVPVFIAAAEACGVDPEAYDGEPGGEYREF